MADNKNSIANNHVAQVVAAKEVEAPLKPSGFVGKLISVKRVRGNITVYEVDLYDEDRTTVLRRVQASLAGDQFIFLDFVTLATSGESFVITTQPQPKIATITGLPDGERVGAYAVEVFRRGSQTVIGASTPTPELSEPDAALISYAFSNIAGLDDATLKLATQVSVVKRQGVLYIVDWFDLGDAAFSADFFCDLFDRADATNLGEYWENSGLFDIRDNRCSPIGGSLMSGDLYTGHRLTSGLQTTGDVASRQRFLRSGSAIREYAGNIEQGNKASTKVSLDFTHFAIKITFSSQEMPYTVDSSDDLTIVGVNEFSIGYGGGSFKDGEYIEAVNSVYIGGVHTPDLSKDAIQPSGGNWTIYSDSAQATIYAVDNIQATSYTLSASVATGGTTVQSPATLALDNFNLQEILFPSENVARVEMRVGAALVSAQTRQQIFTVPTGGSLAPKDIYIQDTLGIVQSVRGFATFLTYSPTALASRGFEHQLGIEDNQLKVVVSEGAVDVLLNEVAIPHTGLQEKECGRVSMANLGDGFSVDNPIGIGSIKAWKEGEQEPMETGFGTYNSDGSMKWKDKYHTAIKDENGVITGYSYNPNA